MSPLTRAADGDVDPTFGRNGVTALPVSTSPLLARAMILQPDNRILVAVSSQSPEQAGRFQLLRYDGNGSLDPTFGVQGKAAVEFVGDNAITALALQADGKIVAAGWTQTGSYNIALARFTRDGALDTVFGRGGTVTTNFPGVASVAQAITIQPDAKILVAGYASRGVPDDTFALVRYLDNGELDRTFGDGGIVTTRFGWARAFGVAVQPDGKILVAGMTQLGSSGFITALVRCHPDGTLDAAFGAGGVAFGPANVSNSALAIALQPDGKIVVAGSDGEWWATLALYRFNGDGTLDSTFRPPDPRSAPGATSLALQSDGKIVVGTSFYDAYDVSGARAREVGTISLGRYNSDGSLDSTFGTRGYVKGQGSNALAIQTDGRIVAAATSPVVVRYDNPSLVDFIIARTPPTIVAQPVAQTIAAGDTVVFNVTVSVGSKPAYQWFKDGREVPGATRAALVLANVTPESAGSYTATVTNAGGIVSSAPASLAVVPPGESGRLVNFSILGHLARGETLTLGTVLGGAGTSGAKPLLTRAAGPSLRQFGINNGLSSPTILVNDTSNGGRVVATNDGWGGSALLLAAFADAGAFPFSSLTSRDAAILQNGTSALRAGSYTMQIADASNAGGVVIAELYDATPANSFTRTTPRLINVSVLKEIGTASVLTAGFTIGGARARTLLVRTVGPSLALAPFHFARVMPAPTMTLTSAASGTTLASNAGWDGDAQIAGIADGLGASGVARTATRDSVLLVTLAPGTYAVDVRPAPLTEGGIALVDVFEVP